MKNNFIFDKGKEYNSFIPKAYRQICKTKYETEDSLGNKTTVEKINRIDAEVLRYIEYKVIGNLVDIEFPTVEQLEQEIRLSNVELEENLDLDKKSSAAALKRLKELGFIRLRNAIKKSSHDSIFGKAYDSKRYVSLNCLNIFKALQKYFADNKHIYERAKKKKRLTIEEGYLSAYIRMLNQQQELDTF